MPLGITSIFARRVASTCVAGTRRRSITFGAADMFCLILVTGQYRISRSWVGRWVDCRIVVVLFQSSTRGDLFWICSWSPSYSRALSFSPTSRIRVLVALWNKVKIWITCVHIQICWFANISEKSQVPKYKCFVRLIKCAKNWRNEMKFKSGRIPRKNVNLWRRTHLS